MTSKNIIVKEDRKFDPFEYQHAFYEYTLEISEAEVNQVLILTKERHNKHHGTTYNHFNVLNFPVLKKLKKQITDILDSHNLLLTNNWAQLYNKGDSHGIHTHPNSIYSGTIYLIGNDPRPTTFYDDVFNPFTNEFKKNTLLMFPSNTPHEVKTLEKDEERLVISFNTFRQGTRDNVKNEPKEKVDKE